MDPRVAGRSIHQIRRYRTNQSVDYRCQREPGFLCFAFHPVRYRNWVGPRRSQLFSLAGCLKVSLEELLLAFGIDVNELKQYASQSESSLAKGSQLEVREPGF